MPATSKPRPAELLLALASAVWALSVAACGLIPAIEPAEVANREPLPSCGTEEAGQLGPWNDDARACLWAAYEAGRPAEFTSRRPTVEGDPITTIYRVLADGSVEIFLDLSRDAYSGYRGWIRSACSGLSRGEGALPPIEFGGVGCVDTRLQDDRDERAGPGARIP